MSYLRFLSHSWFTKLNDVQKNIGKKIKAMQIVVALEPSSKSILSFKCWVKQDIEFCLSTEFQQIIKKKMIYDNIFWNTEQNKHTVKVHKSIKVRVNYNNLHEISWNYHDHPIVRRYYKIPTVPKMHFFFFKIILLKGMILRILRAFWV